MKIITILWVSIIRCLRGKEAFSKVNPVMTVGWCQTFKCQYLARACLMMSRWSGPSSLKIKSPDLLPKVTSASRSLNHLGEIMNLKMLHRSSWTIKSISNQEYLQLNLKVQISKVGNPLWMTTSLLIYQHPEASKAHLPSNSINLLLLPNLA